MDMNMDIHTDIAIKKANTVPFFSLLQITDPLFPIGGYTQSYGLETYVQKGIVKDALTSRNYLICFLEQNFLYNDLLASKLAWEYAEKKEINSLVGLDRLLCACKAPKELRTASKKLGTRFVKIAQKILSEDDFFNTFIKKIKRNDCSGHYSLIYGSAAYGFGIGKEDMLCALCYSTSSTIVTNCAKLVPISQSDGQEILFDVQVTMQRLVEKVEDLDEDSIGICCFGFDLRSMQHERLYTRLYIS